MNNDIFLEPLETSINKKDILNILRYSNNDIVFLSGSLVEGFGNRYSDLDIFIIADSFEDYDKADYAYNFEDIKFQFKKLYDKFNCDIECWSMKNIIEIIEQVDKADIENTEIRTLNQIKVSGLEFRQVVSFMNRFINSICVYNDELYNKLKKQFNIKKFCRIVSRYHINNADNIYIDVIGNIENGSYETAIINSREMLLEALMGYIFSWNVTIDRKKWIDTKLSRLAKQNQEARDILSTFRKLYFNTALLVEEDYKQNALATIELVNKIIELIEIRNGGI